MARKMQDRYVHAACLQTNRGLKAKKPATDHDRGATFGGSTQHGIDIIDIAESDNAIQFVAGDRNNDRIGTGGQQQPVIFGFRSAFGNNNLTVAVNRNDGITGIKVNVVFAVPFRRVDDDFIETLFTRQQRRQHDAVVVNPGLCAENGDVVFVRIAGQDFFYGAHAGHAVADDNQAGFCGLYCGRDVVHLSLAPRRGMRSWHKKTPDAVCLRKRHVATDVIIRGTRHWILYI